MSTTLYFVWTSASRSKRWLETSFFFFFFWLTCDSRDVANATDREQIDDLPEQDRC